MKGIEDVVHKHIKIPSYLMNIIDTPIFQRLGHIKQLTSAEYVFPSARHTRKEHCIGAMYLAMRYAENLGLNETETAAISIASLLHDIFHGPFSHSWDTVVYSLLYPACHKGHDKHRHKVLELLQDKIEVMGVTIQDIADIWDNKNTLLSPILQGPISSDRLDFIKRDTVHTATEHFGYFASDRIINHASLYIDINNNRYLVYHEKAIVDAIQGLNSRLLMYNKVYLHKTVIAASILIEACLVEAVEPLNLVSRTKNLDEFIYLNDSIIDQIISSCDPELDKAKEYAKRLYHRDLPKMISENIIYLSPHIRTNHVPGIKLNSSGDQITWTSRILSNDFLREFSAHDIHVKLTSGTLKSLVSNGRESKNCVVPFDVFWRQKYPHHLVETYYIERIYQL